MKNRKHLKKAQDSLSLKSRLDINKKYSSNNLHDWILSLINVQNDKNILDLCCGRGNQTLKLAEKYNKSKIYAIDISQESLNSIDKEGYKNIDTILMSIDSLPKIPLEKNFFDIIHCAYGLYYAKDAKKVINTAHKILKDNGIFMVVGPTDDNNIELYNIINSVYPIDKDIIFTSRDFMNDIVVPQTKKQFSNITKYYFTNTMTYPSAESFYEYFKASTMYKEKFDKELKNTINNYFEKNKSLIVTKKAMAIIATK